MKRILLTCLLALLLGFLLFFPDQALACAGSGLLLWYKNLVPVLLPFMFLSNLLIRLDCVLLLTGLIHPLLGRLFGTSLYGSYAVLAGFLFGCPMGAKVTGDLLSKNLICEEEAGYLVSFVNNLSPAFIISFAVHQNLQAPSLTGPTLCILYGAPLLWALLCRIRRRSSFREFIPKKKASKVPEKLELIDACILDGVVNIAKIGGYILLFSLMAGVLGLLPGNLAPLKNILGASLEITAGVQAVSQSALSFPVKYLCLLALCSFGGICGLMQTLSVCPMNPAGLRQYLKAKAAILGLCLLLACLFLFL